MTLDNLLNCSRPLYLESGIEGFDYGQVGSCLLLRSAKSLWVVTARHCLWAQPRPKAEDIHTTVEQLWIPQNLAVKSPLSFGFSNARVGSSNTHTAAADIALLDVACDPQPDTTDFCDLSSVPFGPAKRGEKVVIAGYPKHINEIQYPDEQQDGKLRPQRFITSGVVAGEGTAPLLDALSVDAPQTLVSYNGMSGSPVFVVRKQRLKTFAELVGLAVREMTSAGTIDFIPSTVLQEVLSGWAQVRRSSEVWQQPVSASQSAMRASRPDGRA